MGGLGGGFMSVCDQTLSDRKVANICALSYSGAIMPDLFLSDAGREANPFFVRVTRFHLSLAPAGSSSLKLSLIHLLLSFLVIFFMALCARISFCFCWRSVFLSVWYCVM